ncbi:hypothetical protein [Rhodopseudomonas sp. RCAM05734]|uniref:hypothetical protein n=1 Tax=Rhodopseudomonas sp. RCAM05734 TaxID=3457549 RepID=UPI004043D1C1
MSRIGPTFAEEIVAAGLAKLPISWTDAGEIHGYDDLDPDDRAALDAVMAAHDPDRLLPQPTPLEKLTAAGLTPADLRAVLGFPPQ